MHLCPSSIRAIYPSSRSVHTSLQLQSKRPLAVTLLSSHALRNLSTRVSHKFVQALESCGYLTAADIAAMSFVWIHDAVRLGHLTDPRS